MTPARMTGVLLVSLIILLVIYDVVIMGIGGVDASISRVILHAAVGWPFVPFAAGFLCGHLFWSQDLRVRDLNCATPTWVLLLLFFVAAINLIVLLLLLDGLFSKLWR